MRTRTDIPDVETPPAAAAEPVGVPSWRVALLEAAAWVTLLRVAMLLLSWGATWLLATSTRGPHVPSLLQIWDRWDTQHFVHIALHGYSGTGPFANDTAFFPLFPLTIRVLHAAGLDPVAAGMLVSYLASIVAGAVLLRLAEEQVGPGTGRTALLLLLVAPTAVFLVAAYSEALFLAGAIGAFYLARHERWLGAGACAAVAMGARAAGLFLLAGLAVELLTARRRAPGRWSRAVLGGIVALIPLAAYCAYLWHGTGDALDFVAAQRAGWQRTFVGPVASFLNTWRSWSEGEPTNWIFAWRLEIVAAAAGVGFTVWAFVRRWWGYGTYMALTLGYLLTSTWYYSVPRLLLGLFPIFLLLASWAGRGARRDALLVVSALCAALGVIVFTRGAWYF